ncbi:hypothetical protein, partial [Streptomyces sp. WAC06614]|uniref:hypothetical protein n=1 Tax=Streptomyces sp. WAC06614 TaxID=2487416 RepID=UPI000FB40F4B
MDVNLPPAEELALIDRELAQLDARRMQLMLRRDWLVRLLTGTAPAPAAWGAPVAAAGAGATGAPQAAG